MAGQGLSMKQGQGAQRKAQCWATCLRASRVGPSVVVSACSGRGQAERGADARTCWAPAATFVTGPDKWTPLRLGEGQKFRWGRGSGLGKKKEAPPEGAPPSKGGADREGERRQEGD